MVKLDGLRPGMFLRAGAHYRGCAKRKGDCFIEGNEYEIVEGFRGRLTLLCECSQDRRDGHELYFREKEFFDGFEHITGGPW